MSRVEIHEVVLNNTGSGMFPASASVLVNHRDGPEAVIWADATTPSSTLANPIIVSDTNGRIEGWVETGSYDLVVTTAAEEYTQRFEAAPGHAVGDGVNPMAYGAAGDADTDDREAFQFAIASLPAAGGEIIVPNKTFALDCTTPLSLGNRKVVFRGEGSASQLICSNTGTVVPLAMFSLSSFDNIAFEDLQIQGPVSLGAAGRFDIVNIDTAFSTVKFQRCTLGRFSRAVHVDPTGNWIGTLDIDSCNLTGYASTGDHASTAVKVITTGSGTRNKRVNIRNSSLAAFGNAADGSTHGIDVPSDCDLDIHGNDFVSSVGTGYCIQISDSSVSAANGSADQKIHDNHFAVGLSCSCVGIGGVARPRIYNNTVEVSTPLVYAHSGTPDVDVDNNLMRGAAGLGAVNIGTAGSMRVHNNHFHSTAAGATAQVFAITTAADKLLVFDNDFSQASGASVLLTAVPAIYNEWGNHGSAHTALATAASATALVLPTVTQNNVVSVTGTTNIESITLRPAGARLTLVFAGILTVVDASTLVLAGDFVTTANDTLSLVSTGLAWVETNRSVN